jgi:NAD(P)-dependent dehydrogenase (short-subunit alcohol dehydrogenase family)
MHDDSDPSVRAEVAFVRATHLVPRALDASEVAAAVHFLVSDDCTHLTGSILPLDGGSSAGPSTQLLQLASTRLDELPARPAP